MSLTRMISFLANVVRGRGYYGKYRKMYKKNIKEIPSFRLILSLANGDVLDLGCGIGYLSFSFDNYVGVDINKEAVNIAKKNTYGEYVIASATNLPFRSNAFDTCVSYDFIEHVGSVEYVLIEMKRVSAKVIISCADFSSYYRFLSFDETHQNLLMPNEFVALLTKYFAQVRLFKTSGLFVAPRLVNAFLSKHFPNQIVLEASA